MIGPTLPVYKKFENVQIVKQFWLSLLTAQVQKFMQNSHQFKYLIVSS